MTPVPHVTIPVTHTTSPVITTTQETQPKVSAVAPPLKKKLSVDQMEAIKAALKDSGADSMSQIKTFNRIVDILE